MMTRRLVGSLAVLALVFTCAPSALAQITAATISGTIKDETGGSLPGAGRSYINLATLQPGIINRDGRRMR
jgi:hypothetical protein